MESDLLSESTRKTRKSMLTFALIGILISRIQVTIGEVSVLGTKFIVKDFGAIPVILALVVLYFLLSFGFNGLNDFSIAHRKRREDLVDKASSGRIISLEDAEQQRSVLQNELVNLEKEIAGLLSRSEREPLSNQISIRKNEIAKLEKIIGFYQYYRGSFFERLRLQGLSDFMNLWLPMFVGTLAVVLLLLFTKLPSVPAESEPAKGTQVLSSQSDSSGRAPISTDSLSVLHTPK